MPAPGRIRRRLLASAGIVAVAAPLAWIAARRKQRRHAGSALGEAEQRALVGGDALRADLVVVGGGLGGVVAALRAAELGLRVVLLEARPDLGGTALYSGGGVHIWGARSWEEYREHCPLADPVLARRLFDSFAPTVQWLLASGAPGEYSTTEIRGLSLAKYQVGTDLLAPGRIDFFAHLVRLLQRHGCRIVTGARGKAMLRSGGVIRGVRAERDGLEFSVLAPQVVLAAGGFQNDRDLLARHVGAAAASFMSRAVATDVGDGLRMALAAGAATTPRMNTVYGHLMPAPPCRPEWDSYNALLLLSVFYAEHGVVVNAAGYRFVDEGAGELTGLTINAAVQQPPGDLWVVLDEGVRRDYAQYELPRESLRPSNLVYQGLSILRYLAVRRGASGLALRMDSLRYAEDRGASVLHAETLEDLARQLGAQGVDSFQLLATLRDYNVAVRPDGTAPDLAVPKMKGAHRLDRAPFHAIKVVPGISMTYGGVRIDAQARALDASDQPVAGLYAVPGTAGGIHHLHYAGALVSCATFGKIAGETVAAERRALGQAAA